MERAVISSGGGAVAAACRSVCRAGSGQDLSPRAAFVGGLGVTLAFWAMLAVYVPPSMLWWEYPPVNLDYPTHYYSAVNAYDSFRVTGRAVGAYVPYLMAGHPFLEPTSSRAIELAAVLFGRLGLVAVFNGAVFVMVWSVPLLCWWTASRALPDRRARLITLALLMGCFMLKTYHYVSVGMVSHAVCVVACGALVVGFGKLCARFSWPMLAANCAMAFYALLLHPAAGVMCLVPCGVIVVAQALRGRFRPALLAVVIGGVALAGNAYWWVPVMTQNRGMIGSLLVDPFGQTGDLATKVAAAATLLAATHGVLVWRRKSPGGPAWPLYAGGVALLLISVVGKWCPVLCQTEPVRFRDAGVFFLLPAVGVSFSQATGWMATWLRNERRRRARVAAAAVLALGVAAALPARGLSPLREVGSGGYFPALCEHLRAHTDRSGRILLEETASAPQQNVQQGAPLGVYCSGYLVRAVRRELISGPHQTQFLRNHYASFYGGLLFRRPVLDYTASEFRQLCRTFNIRWVYCWSDAAREAMRRFAADLRPLGTVGPFQAYEVDLEPSFVVGGGGEVRAEVGLIRVTGADQPVTVLKYHWYEQLRASPPLPLRPRLVEPAELPFIEIANGRVRDFVIRQ